MPVIDAHPRSTTHQASWSAWRARRGTRGLLALAALAVLTGLAPHAARAQPMVTYDWVTDQIYQGVAPTSASFQAPLSSVQTGTLSYFDITNIQYSFPGIGPLSFTTPSSIGSDFAAYVDPLTGSMIYKTGYPNQGLAAVGYEGSLFSNTFLSITIGNVQPNGTQVTDLFNAINGGPGSLGYGAGHWVAVMPAVPEPGEYLVLLTGIGMFTLVARRTRRSI